MAVNVMKPEDESPWWLIRTRPGLQGPVGSIEYRRLETNSVGDAVLVFCNAHQTYVVSPGPALQIFTCSGGL